MNAGGREGANAGGREAVNSGGREGANAGTGLDPGLRRDLFRYVLGLADDALILAQRTGEWTSNAPELEEDVALANIALDLLGQARRLLSHAGELEGAGSDEDALAYLRDEREFLNVQLVELPNGDFGQSIIRLLFFSSYQYELYRRLADSTDPVLAAIAAKAVKEVAYHRDHAARWTIRLGDGTPESHRRVQAAFDELWPYTHELFRADGVVERLVGSGLAILPSSLRSDWSSTVDAVRSEATLALPETSWEPAGGRNGSHTESMGRLLADLQYLHRAHPGARW
jgi:ring-1,2-phenylacetyl-CoA epoxidase subunit PaaC